MAKINLSRIDTRAPKEFEKQATKERTAALLEELNELQNLLYAEGKHSILVILQGMDASGKDGLIRKVLGTMNPQGVQVRSFKVPTEEELSHDFLWRIHQNVPAKGMIQVFNRSHYEDILVTRVHGWCDDAQAKKRIEAINAFEKLLRQHNGTQIIKCYLHISPEEQSERLRERLSNPAKMWKYNKRDFDEAKLWDKYRKMYEECFEQCDDPEWNIIPADQNWYKEFVLAEMLVKTLKGLKMQYPGLPEERPTDK